MVICLSTLLQISWFRRLLKNPFNPVNIQLIVWQVLSFLIFSVIDNMQTLVLQISNQATTFQRISSYIDMISSTTQTYEMFTLHKHIHFFVLALAKLTNLHTFEFEFEKLIYLKLIHFQFIKYQQLNQTIQKLMSQKQDVSRGDKKSKQYHQTKKEEIQAQFTKLLQITMRCIDYYKKFQEDRSIEENLYENRFNQIIKYVETLFKSLNDSLQVRKNDLIIMVQQKKISFKNNKLLEEKQLRDSLNKIINLKKQYIDQSIQHNNYQLTSKNKELSMYANSLNKFYEKIEEIEKSNHRAMLQKNDELIRKEIKQSISQLISVKLYSEDNYMNISFDNDIMFSPKNTKIQHDYCVMKEQLKPDLLLQISNKQKQRLKNIKCYKQSLSTN